MEEPLITPEELSETLRITLRTLRRWRVQEKGPEFVRVGPKAIRYPKSAVDKYIAKQTVQTDQK